MTEEIRSQILNVTEIGKAAYHQLRAERFVEKLVRFSSPIHHTFSSLHKTTKEIEEKPSKKRKERNEMTRAIDVARARERTMEELMKCALVQELEARLNKDDVTTMAKASSRKTAHLVDVLACVRKIKTTELKTFGDYCKTSLNTSSQLLMELTDWT